jgi:hypothetical protein
MPMVSVFGGGGVRSVESHPTAEIVQKKKTLHRIHRGEVQR